MIREGKFFVTDAEALDILPAFVRQHVSCGAHAMSTEYAEHRDFDKINVTKWCLVCGTSAAAAVTRSAARALLRQRDHRQGS